jgi:hypothetical protein
MTRLRTKGGASPQSLYELYNAYVDASKVPRQRPASRWQFSAHSLSKGLVWFKGAFYTFSAHVLIPPAGSINKVLLHPVVGYAGEIKQIHFAQPFMGQLWVVAEFTADGATPAAIYHYWLQEPKVWQPFHVYGVNELVQPTVPNGLYYKATMSIKPPAWQPLTQYATGDPVQPTTYNGFYYAAQNLLPASPTTSSDTEPVWPTVPDQYVLEASSGSGSSQPPAPPDAPPTMPAGTELGGRYGNPGGSGAKGGLINPWREP